MSLALLSQINQNIHTMYIAEHQNTYIQEINHGGTFGNHSVNNMKIITRNSIPMSGSQWRWRQCSYGTLTNRCSVYNNQNYGKSIDHNGYANSKAWSRHMQYSL